MSLIDIFIKDTFTGKIHKIGDDPHDSLYVENGQVYYYNLQNSGGIDDGYEFVDYDPLMEQYEKSYTNR